MRPRDTQRDQALSELLQVKRLEQPKAEFWDDFDASLNRKLLSSAVNAKRSTANRIHATFAALRQALPLTASAACLVVLFFGTQMAITPTEAPIGEAYYAYESASTTSIAASEVVEPVSTQAAEFSETAENPLYVVGSMDVANSQADFNTIPARYSMAAVYRGNLNFASPILSNKANTGEISLSATY